MIEIIHPLTLNVGFNFLSWSNKVFCLHLHIMTDLCDLVVGNICALVVSVLSAIFIQTLVTQIGLCTSSTYQIYQSLNFSLFSDRLKESLNEIYLMTNM